MAICNEIVIMIIRYTEKTIYNVLLSVYRSMTEKQKIKTACFDVGHVTKIFFVQPGLFCCETLHFIYMLDAPHLVRLMIMMIMIVTTTTTTPTTSK